MMRREVIGESSHEKRNTSDATETVSTATVPKSAGILVLITTE